LESQPWEQHRDAVARRAAEDEPLIDVELAPGDSLYLPRGTIHSAAARGQTSIHLTVGIHPLTRHDVLEVLLRLAEDDPELRTSLPLGGDLGDPAVLAPRLAETAVALRAHLDSVAVDHVARGLGDYLTQRTRPEPIGPLRQLAVADALGLDSRLRMRAGLRARTSHDHDTITITLFDRTVALPLAALDAVKLIVSGVAFAVRELPGLDHDEQLTVARRLLHEGVLVPA
jgi:hypothetical protein